MTSLRYLFLFTLLCTSLCAAHAQQQPGTIRDSIAQSKVMVLLESKFLLRYYDENINTPGDFISSSQVETFVKRRPGIDFEDYWIQVRDHRRYEGDGVVFNFYVNPKTWKVYYYDTEHNLVWSLEQWQRQRNAHQSWN